MPKVVGLLGRLHAGDPALIPVVAKFETPFEVWVTASGLAYAIPPYKYRRGAPGASVRIYVKCILGTSKNSSVCEFVRV
jgi:hypothetical protein